MDSKNYLSPVEDRTLPTIPSECDARAIRRSAKTLKSYLLTLTPSEDRHRLREKILPIVADALAGKLKLPFDARNEPLRYEATIGLLPKEYMCVSAQFWLHITGSFSKDPT